MPRSHPPTLSTLCSKALREECGVGRGARILVAVSGGPDSLALLHVLSLLAPRLGLSVAAHGVDHGLRAEANAELDLSARLSESWGVPFSRTRVDVAEGGNLQARARAARYEALESAQRALSAEFLATAHHADDRAETVLLRLLRGAGPRGLAVLPARAGTRIRPLIRARRADVDLHLERHHILPATDPSNRDPRFLRVRVRQELLPLLSELSPGIVAHLNALADALVSSVSSESGAEPARSAGDGLPDPRRREPELGRAHIALLSRARALKQGNARVRLPGGWEARYDPVTGETSVAKVRGTSRRS
jgi:tRNA(Ile)-lysidine synthase